LGFKRMAILSYLPLIVLGGALGLELITPTHEGHMRVAVIVLVASGICLMLARLLIWDRPLVRRLRKLQALLPGLTWGQSGADSQIADQVLRQAFLLRDTVRDLYRITARLVTAEHLAKRLQADLEADQVAGDLASPDRPRGQEPEPGTIPYPGVPLGKVIDDMAKTMHEVTELLRSADEDAKELATFAEETAYSISRLDRFLQEMADRGRELETSTDAANRVALDGTKVVEEVAKENEAIITAVKEAATAVEGLGRWSREVGKILEVIRDIADETNLLSLNAAIIAAQSGEHGKAFGVVAEEIRGLAERTSSSTQEISDLVKTLQKNVADVVESMNKSLHRVERGSILTRNAGSVLEKVFESFESSRNLAKQIADSTLEYKMESSHVVRSIRKVADIARHLESEKFSKWTSASESVAVARAVATVAAAVGSQTGSAGNEAPERASRRGLSAVEPASHRSPGGAGRDVAGMAFTLRQLVSDLVEQVHLVTQEARSACQKLPLMHEEIGKRCWEIIDCPEEQRLKCPAYEARDRRCFIIGTGCASVQEGQPGRRCYSCPVFEVIIESLEQTTSELER